MRIAILGTRGIPSGYSGYEAFAEELGVRLVRKGHQVVVYAHANLFEKRPDEYRGVQCIYLPSLKGKNTSQFSHSLLATLHASLANYDVVLFCNAANGPFGFILRLFGKRCAINVDGLEWLRPKWGRLAKTYFKFGARASTWFFNVVVTDAKGMRDYYLTEFGADSVCIAYGADPKVSEKPDLVRALGLEPGQYYLIASRLVPDNNADLIVKAFVASSSKRTLAIAGGTNYRNPFEDYVRSLADKRVVFLGHIDSSEVIKELHCNAYAYIHGHEFGGTNPALLKGLAYGNCILALDTVFNREVLADGTYGVLFTKDSANLRSAIDMLDSDVSRTDHYRSRSRERIAERYTWDQITEEYESLFQSLAR